MFSSTNVATTDDFLNDMVGGAKAPVDMIKLLVVYIFILYSPLYSPKVKESIEHLFNNTPSRIVWTFALFWALCGCIQTSLILTVVAQALLYMTTDYDDYPLLDYEYPSHPVVAHDPHDTHAPAHHAGTPQPNVHAQHNCKQPTHRPQMQTIAPHAPSHAPSHASVTPAPSNAPSHASVTHASVAPAHVTVAPAPVPGGGSSYAAV